MRWRPSWVLGLIVIVAGVALATSPFYDAAGESGPPEAPTGSILDLRPTYGALLMIAGAAIAGCGLLAAILRKGAPALVAAAIALIAGVSLAVVTYEIHNGVIDRAWTIFELRGRGPWQAGISALIACCASLALAAAEAGLNPVSSKGPGDP